MRRIISFYIYEISIYISNSESINIIEELNYII